jgi:UDP-arabinose 4-epimerase
VSRILVTGGAGYIGSHSCKALAEAGNEPIVYDNLSTGHASFVRWGRLVEGDIRDRARLSGVIAETKRVAVMHFAALALVGESVADPLRYHDVNVVGTLRLLEAMRENGLSRLVFSSSCAVYGEPAVIPIGEATPERPVNPYGASKVACERMIRDCDGAHGLKSVLLRYFNAAGADRSAEIGEWHVDETHLIPLAIMAATGDGPQLRIFGSDYPTPDGTAIRDFIHVDDLASAHVAAVNHLIRGGQAETFNLGTGTGSSVAAVVAAVGRVAGRPVPVEHAPRRPGDPPNLVADPARAIEALQGWRTERSDLPSIVEDAWRWHRQLSAE